MNEKSFSAAPSSYEGSKMLDYLPESLSFSLYSLLCIWSSNFFSDNVTPFRIKFILSYCYLNPIILLNEFCFSWKLCIGLWLNTLWCNSFYFWRCGSKLDLLQFDNFGDWSIWIIDSTKWSDLSIDSTKRSDSCSSYEINTSLKSFASMFSSFITLMLWNN